MDPQESAGAEALPSVWPSDPQQSLAGSGGGGVALAMALGPIGVGGGGSKNSTGSKSKKKESRMQFLLFYSIILRTRYKMSNL